MRVTRFILVSILVLVYVSPAPAKKDSRAKEQMLGIPCAVFAQDGRWATANFTESALRVRLGNPSGESHFYNLPVVLKKVSQYYFPGCGLFFSPDGHYLATSQSVEGESQYYRLHIAVLNTGAGRWVSSFDVLPQGVLQSYFQLSGFLGNSHNLVITGLNNRDPRSKTTSFSSALFNLKGAVTNPPGAIRPKPPDLIGLWDEVDPQNDRVWGFGLGTSIPCHWRSVTLTGPLAYGPTFDERAVGNVACGGFFFAFPDENTIVGATDNSNHNWVWRVDLATDSGEKLTLPESKPAFPLYRNWYNVRRGSLSPDGQVFVVDRDLARDVFDTFHQQPDVLTAVQVRPLHVLGTVQLKDVCPVRALAADHRNGQTKALIYACGKWESLSIPPASRK